MTAMSDFSDDAEAEWAEALADGRLDTQPNQYEDKSQEDLIDFVTSESTIRAASEGSMEKRQAVFDQYEDKELREAIRHIFQSSTKAMWRNPDHAEFPQENYEDDFVQLITQKQLEAYDAGYKQGVTDEITCVETSGEHVQLELKKGLQ